MMRQVFILILLTAQLMVPQIALAGGTIAVDNDLFALNGNDRDYTGGIRYTSDEVEGRTTQFGLLLHTPENIGADMFEQGERPYASLLYLGRTSTFVKSESVLYKRTMTVGVLGSKFGEAAQRFIHRQVDSPEPMGYENQISDGGELTGRLGLARYRKVIETSTQAGALTIVEELTGSVGYITDATVGVGFRLETRYTSWWGNSSHDFLPHLDAPAQSDGLHGFFGGVRVRARAYNVLLQGQFRDSPVTIAADQLNRYYVEAWVGAATVIQGWQVRYTLRASESEVRNGRADRAQLWGTLVVRRVF